MKTLLSRAALAAAAMALGLSGAHATYYNSATGNLTVKLVIAPGCAVTSPTIDFGSPSALVGTVTAQSNILVTCSNGTPYSVTLGPGSHGNNRGRFMAGTGSNAVSYDLYWDTPGGTSWSGTTAVSRTGSGGQDFITVYGQANVAAANTDTYSDVVQITVNY